MIAVVSMAKRLLGTAPLHRVGETAVHAGRQQPAKRQCRTRHDFRPHPPHDDDAEMAVLGMLMRMPSAKSPRPSTSPISPAARNQTVYEAIISLFACSQPVDAVN